MAQVKPKRQILQTVSGERVVPGGRELQLSYRAGDEPPVPAILSLPAAPGKAPAALLLHGYGSGKEALAGPLGGALLAQGIASLAIDLMREGGRNNPLQAQSAGSPLALVQLWRQGLAESRLGLRYLAARSEIDRGRLAVVGYSMGSFLAVTLAADEPLVRAVVLAAGGDLPEGMPLATVARMAVDPMRSVRRLDGRPLLMVHGRHDRTVRPEQAQRLFAAAREPREIRWWDAGHRLPPGASDEVAGWLRARLGDAVDPPGGRP